MAEKDKVLLEIRASIDGVQTVQEVEASFASNGSVDVLIYEEDTEAFGKVRNFMTIHENKIHMKRSGGITMNQQFVRGEKTESIYRHPYGNFHMEMDTKRVEVTSGRVILEYMSKINGTEEQEHHLEMKYVKENKS